MADVYRDQDHNLNKILNADLTLIDPFLLPTGVLLSEDVIGATGIVITDNLDGTITIGSSAPTGPLVGYIDDLSDVDTSTTGPIDGQVLLWNDAIQQWVPGYQAGGLGYRERFNVLDPATQLPLRVVHGLDVVTGVVDVTVAEMGPPTKLVQAEVTILDENTIDVHLPGAVAGSFEVLVLSEGEGSATGPSGPQQLIDEVFVGATDPYVTDPSSTAELWYTPLDAYGPTGPTIPTGVLRASVNGVWEIVGGVAGIDDLTDVDTATTGPTGGNALVWDETVQQWVPGTVGIQFWEPAVNYDIDDMVLWPETAPSSLWKASAANIDEEPTPSTTVEPNGVVFAGPPADIGAGIGAVSSHLLNAGFEVRLQTDGTVGMGTLLAVGPGGAPYFRVQQVTAGYLQIVLFVGVGFTNDRALADFPSLNHIKIKAVGSTINWYSSADGVTWTEVGTTTNNPVGLGTGEILWVQLGNDGASGAPSNYSGVLRAVEIYNAAGTAPLTSWVRATQPDALGEGVSAKTGEVYTPYDPNGLMLDDPLPGTPSSWLELITGASTIDSLTDVDTGTTGPTDGQSLVWDEATGQWVPGNAQIGFWDPVVDYVTEDMVLWPETAPSSLWKASADNVGVEPAASATQEPTGILFPGPTSGVESGFRTTPLAGFDNTTGFDIRIQTDGTVGTDTILSGNIGANTAFMVSVNNGTDISFVTYPAMPFSGTRPVADFSSLNYIRVVVTATTIDFYSSADGSSWNPVGTQDSRVETLLTGLINEISIGIHGAHTATYNYAGTLRSVEIYDVTGTTLMSSWKRSTQPDALGAGISPQTGENWAVLGPVTDDPPQGTVNPWLQLIGGASKIDDLSDVDTSTTGPTGGSALIWDETVNQWVPGVASTVASLDDLTDVSIYPTGPTGPTGPSDGDALVWDEALGQWVPGHGSEVEVDTAEPTGDWELWVDTSALKPPPGAAVGLAIDDLTDVDTVTTAPVDTGPLVWDSTTSLWIPGAAPAPPYVLPASTTINAVLENSWAASGNWTNMGGTAVQPAFRVTATSVTFAMCIWRAAAVTGNAAVKICGYPSGVPGPFQRLIFLAWQYQSQLVSTNPVAIECRPDGIYCLGGSPGYTGGSGNVTEKNLMGTVTWAR